MTEVPARPVRVAVVGTGSVGATFAYALLFSGLAAEIVLINRDRDKAEGEAMDLTHAVPFTHPTRVWAGDYPDCAGAAVTVLTAGSAQGDNDSRLDLVEKNGAIFRDIVPEVARHNPDGMILVATNPVDALAYAAWRLSGLPPERVIGSGTILDTSRFRALLGEHFRVDPTSVHADIIGEHGDSEVPVWSRASIAGMSLSAFCAAHGIPYDEAALGEIFRHTRDAAKEVVERKGATYYAVAAGMIRIVEAILRDQRTVLPVSSLVRDYHGIDDVYLSLPCVVGRAGIEQVIRLDLGDGELEGLLRSADILREATAKLDLS